MTVAGQWLLLAALVASGYAAFASVFAWQKEHRGLERTGWAAGLIAALALSAVSGILTWALATRDFDFDYVAHYTSQALTWQYAVSAFWVGQAGSLLLWAWMLAVLALAYRFWPRRENHPLRGPAFGLLMAYVWFLTAVMVFAADPMAPSLARPDEGAGLSPSLQHPAMLLHPPVVFLGYAGWAIPCALAMAALAARRLDVSWIEEARPWMLFSWLVLGLGILWGAQWAYEELGWGGYWAWDPVENGSLIPWLTGTALVHAAMVWQYRGALKKTTCGLAVATFGFCNFATFLTRSGIFSSLHAFSESPIGWMFLVLMAALVVGGAWLVVRRRVTLAPEGPMRSLWSRETAIALAAIALVLLAATATVGTILVPLSGPLVGRRIVLGPEFYNSVLIPTGLVLLLTTAPAPLLRWGKPPTAAGRQWLLRVSAAAVVAGSGAWFAGLRHPIGLAVAALAFMAAGCLAAEIFEHARAIATSKPIASGRRPAGGTIAVGRPSQAVETAWEGRPTRFLAALSSRRRQYAGFLIHVSFVCLALGVTGSSLGSRDYELLMAPGEVVAWGGRSIRFAGIVERELPEVHVVEARLEISRNGEQVCLLAPAQHLHQRGDQWTTEIAIHSTWLEDFYTVFYYGEDDGSARLAFIQNPMVSWLWASGWIAALGSMLRFWPARRRTGSNRPGAGPAAVPHQRRSATTPMCRMGDAR
ncbi:MAG: cytochrome c biogenesis protein CcsA [Pirellulales bacterium]|nr:cytochrome c biogenesis protein CcsA [Pirellulales bacterium]